MCDRNNSLRNYLISLLEVIVFAFIFSLFIMPGSGWLRRDIGRGIKNWSSLAYHKITGSPIRQDKWVWVGYRDPPYGHPPYYDEYPPYEYPSYTHPYGYPFKDIYSHWLKEIAFSPTTGIAYARFNDAVVKMTSPNYEEDKWALCFSISKGKLSSIAFNKEGDVFVGSNACIYVSRDQGNHWSKMENTPKFHYVEEMLWNQGTLWVGDADAVYTYDGSWNKVLEAGGKKSFARSPEGMFVGVYGKGIYYQRYGEGWSYFDLKKVIGWTTNRISDIVFSQGKLWVIVTTYGSYDGPYKGGIFTYNGKTWEWVRPHDEDSVYGLSHSTVLAADSSGNIWFGSNNNPIGVYKFSDGKWKHFETVGGHTNLLDSFAYKCVSFIGVDSQNRKWFGCRNLVITVLTEKAILDNNVTIRSNQFALFQNDSNPFYFSTDIPYQLIRPARVILTIYNSRGRMVKKLVDKYQQAGDYRVRFKADRLPSGVYSYHLQVGKYIKIKKMNLK